ncbi:hypothetical protein SCHPADRAFT_348776 [Schizopora paradoxa]|uniref:Uncharacterized protein n=1 Tax=Schizopora paradoxa TaxID=27342 RepID=A0A0H2S9Z6_9AGAM|nr:hypothetical protein SCHPADRAFT_348776 [Schizopora paradoxa]
MANEGNAMPAELPEIAYDDIVEHFRKTTSLRYYDVMDIPSQISNTVGANQLAGLWISILGVYFPPKRYRIVPDFASGSDPEKNIALSVVDLKGSWPKTIFILDISFPGVQELRKMKITRSGIVAPFGPSAIPKMKPSENFIEHVKSICTTERLFAAVVQVHEVKFFEYVSDSKSFRGRIRESWQQIPGLVDTRKFDELDVYNVSFDKQSVHYILKGIAEDVE